MAASAKPHPRPHETCSPWAPQTARILAVASRPGLLVGRAPLSSRPGHPRRPPAALRPPSCTRGRETGQEQRKRLVSHSSAKCPSLRRPASASQASEKQPHLFPGAASSPCACGGGGRGEVAIYSAAPISELQTCGGSFTRWMERPGKLQANTFNSSLPPGPAPSLAQLLFN